MKLILTHEVSRLGAPGDIVEVKDGYGRNYLMPRGFAVRWTKGAAKQIDTLKKARQSREVRDLGHAQEIRAQLEAMTVQLPVRAGDTGRLFGAVTVADIAQAITASGGPEVDRRRIDVRQPIKSLGSHTVTVRVHDEASADVTVEVVPA
ncbi:MAG: 50S ribosomal protein L9 [Nocardioidaceae bacterium]|jgi:large subunit ribosomal protein L9|nr:50S ribosomal protein L9 [Nocardioidaceae bacterium]MDQ3325086.1 50S ribosomal protein L9 [Actinomycetota bacterium]